MNTCASSTKKNIDFSMDTGPWQKETRNSQVSAMSSRTLIVYYGGLAIVMIVLSLFIR